MLHRSTVALHAVALACSLAHEAPGRGLQTLGQLVNYQPIEWPSCSTDTYSRSSAS